MTIYAGYGRFAPERDIDKNPYSADESRVARWMCDKIGIGGGDDPIGFVIVSHETLAAERNHLRDLLRRFRDKHIIKSTLPSDDPIWAEVADAIQGCYG